ncbi:MAG: hypothetical protein M3451_10005 [Chloroflexota bacterium]|nr:hypothetical protein [Acidobacteriota bacterium]MDQ3525372.1 hypothetical protein [Chloroflexota bacterium]
MAAYAELLRISPDDDIQDLLAVAREDLLFIAELHHTCSEDWRDGIDLEHDCGLVVLIDESTAPSRLDAVPLDADQRIRTTIDHPVQLEAVPAPHHELARYWGEDLDADVEFWQQHSRVLTRPTHRRWDDDRWGFLLFDVPLSPTHLPAESPTLTRGLIHEDVPLLRRADPRRGD